MAFTSVAITPGSGAAICVDAVSGLDVQVVKLDFGASGASSPAVADGSGNLQVNLAAITSGFLVPVTATAANFKVDASGVTVPISAASAIPVSAANTAPVAVRISSGSAWVDTIPVTGTVAATQSGAWAAKITDGTNNVHLTNPGSGNYALDVNVVSSVAIGGTAADDGATFTAGATPLTPIGGVYNDSVGAVTSGDVGAARITANRGLHANPRNASGAEIGTAASPLYVSPATSPNTQPVSGTVTANQGTASGSASWAVNVKQIGGAAVAVVGTGIQQVSITDSSGNALSDANPLFTAPSAKARTRVTKSVSLSTGTAVAAWTPTSGKAFYITKAVIVISVSDTLAIFDSTNAAANLLSNGTMPTGFFTLDFEAMPWASAAVNNVLEYTAGSSLVGVLTLHGFEE